MTVSQVAFKDITKHLKRKFPWMYKREPRADYYIVTPAMLNTKENRRLNKELGLTHINKIGKLWK